MNRLVIALCFCVVTVLAGEKCTEPAEIYWGYKGKDIAYGASIDDYELVGHEWNDYSLGGVAALCGLQADLAPHCTSDLSPVFRMYNYASKSHFYTHKLDEMKAAVLQYNYTYEGVAYYVATSADQCPGTKPVFRYYIGVNYYYTFDKGQGDFWVANYKARDDGIVSYCWLPGTVLEAKSKPKPISHETSGSKKSSKEKQTVQCNDCVPSIEDWKIIFSEYTVVYEYVFTFESD